MNVAAARDCAEAHIHTHIHLTIFQFSIQKLQVRSWSGLAIVHACFLCFLVGKGGAGDGVALDPAVWYSTVCEGCCMFMAAWVKEEEKASEHR